MEKESAYINWPEERSRLRSEIEDLQNLLSEANDTLDAIRSGEIDALVVKGENGHQLFTLKSADQSYRIFIEQMTEGAVTLNSNGVILYANSQFASMVSLPLEQVPGKPFSNFVAPAEKDFFDHLLVKSWKSSAKGECSLLNTGGKVVPVLLSLKTLEMDEGVSMSIIITDLTDQKTIQQLLESKNHELQESQRETAFLNNNLEKTVTERTRELKSNIEVKAQVERELRENQERLRQVLDTMAEGVTIVNMNGYVSYANPMAKKLLDLGEADTIDDIFNTNRWASQCLDGSALPKNEHPLVIALTSGEPVYDNEICMVFPDRKVYISFNAAPLRDDAGEIIAAIGTFMDVTNRRLLQQQKDDFISIASHELRTPISSLKASLQLLDRMKNAPQSVLLPTLVTQANKSLNKVSTLIADLLNASKMANGQLHMKRSSFVIGELVTDCCHSLRTQAPFPIRIHGDIELRVFADADRVEQVLINLLNNAVKYAATSDEVVIAVEKANAFAKVSVSDKGMGIAPEKIPHLFDRYYRVDSSGQQFSGLGLGLYIAAEIIKRHGGTINVESNPGVGSTFWFTVPLDKNDQPFP